MTWVLSVKLSEMVRFLWLQMKAILHDRNEFMIKHLRDMNGKIIAVVGLAHMEGMEKLWREAEP